jgi:hypothetical protein
VSGRARLGMVLALLVGCASAGGAGEPAGPAPGEGPRLLATEEAEARRPEAPPPVAPEAPVAAPTPSGGICAEFVRPGVLRRSAVARVVDRGLGQWLSQVEVKALRSGRKFSGWQVVQLYPDDPCYRAVDVQRGDVVTRVNGTSLEKPDQANQVFQKLRTAPALEIVLLRQGVARRVSLTIVD